MSSHPPLPNRLRGAERGASNFVDPLLAPMGAASLGAMPAPLLTFEGVNNRNGKVPPDTNGDVGPNHYVQWINLSFAVWDKSGSLLYGPADGNTLWQGFGGICETSNNGDPLVVHDPLADRWVMSQLAFQWPQNFHHCVAVSETPDPTGAWYRYDFFFSQTTLNDYPKMGVWPDAYYVGVNQYTEPGDAWAGQGVLAYERAQMLVGGPARVVYFDLHAVNENFGGALPSDLDGPLPPPEGAPNYFVEMDDDSFGWTPIDRLSLWRFHVDWTVPILSTFGVGGQPNAVLDLTAAGQGFDSDMCGYASGCIPQPAGAVDALSDRLMYRLAYRNLGDREALVVNHTVDVGSDHAGVRWYEIRDPGGSPTVAQAGTHAPDADHRWMASIAMDGAGNAALGYSVSGAATFPSIRYAGRLATDPPGTLPQAEATLMAGTGYQTGAARWGDYSSMSVDPTDDCTFWYTQEYYTTTSGYTWQTRVGSFRFDSCRSCPLLGLPTLTLDKEPPGVRIAWTVAENAQTYDVVEGDLELLRASAGDFAPSIRSCLANDQTATTLYWEGPDPTPGQGFWYLVRGLRGLCRGSLDEPAGSQRGSRDAEVSASPSACP